MNEIKSKHLRKYFKKQENYTRKPCYICGGHEDITELHHIVPLKEYCSYLNSFVEEVKTPPVVWLCPNHHRYVHVGMVEPEKAVRNLEDKEREKFMELYFKRIETLKEVINYRE